MLWQVCAKYRLEPRTHVQQEFGPALIPLPKHQILEIKRKVGFLRSKRVLQAELFIFDDIPTPHIANPRGGNEAVNVYDSSYLEFGKEVAALLGERPIKTFF